MTPRECARLQSMESLKVLPDASTPAYKALGNAINVHVMRLIAEALVGRNGKGPKSTVCEERRAHVQAAAAA